MNSLLQLDFTSGGAAGLFVYLFLLVIAFIIGVLFTRWIFRIDTMVHYMKRQSDLLSMIARYNNVPLEEIYKTMGLKIPKKTSQESTFDKS